MFPLTVQMATLDKAQALLDELRSASYKAAVKDHEELKEFVKEQVILHCSANLCTSRRIHAHILKHAWSMF